MTLKAKTCETCEGTGFIEYIANRCDPTAISPDYREEPCPDDCEEGLVQCLECGDTPAYGDGPQCAPCIEKNDES